MPHYIQVNNKWYKDDDTKFVALLSAIEEVYTDVPSMYTGFLQAARQTGTAEREKFDAIASSFRSGLVWSRQTRRSKASADDFGHTFVGSSTSPEAFLATSRILMETIHTYWANHKLPKGVPNDHTTQNLNSNKYLTQSQSRAQDLFDSVSRGRSHLDCATELWNLLCNKLENNLQHYDTEGIITGLRRVPLLPGNTHQTMEDLRSLVYRELEPFSPTTDWNNVDWTVTLEDEATQSAVQSMQPPLPPWQLYYDL